jgi:taurine dioxygenase
MNVVTRSRLEIVPLTQHIGAELRGLDLSQPLSDADVAAINKAWLDHIVILFRGQKLEQEDLLRLTSYFGAIGHIRRPPKYFPPGFNKILPNIMLISNIRENGEPIGALPDGEMMFHHDMIHSANPDAGTLLYSVEIPSQGGDTLFASGYAAYETMDPALRDKLEGKRARHHYNYGSVQKGDGKGTEAFGEATHPLFRTHDQTNRKAVYVNRLMTVGIEGMSDEEATPLLNQVFDHSEKPEFVYAHKWQVGDVLLWDNRCSTHARTDFPSTERRLMLRTTIESKAPPF